MLASVSQFGYSVGDSYVLNSGDVLYLSNSSSHSAADRGGSVPVIGRHSTMLSPDSVRRVTPPTTTIANTSDAETKSHLVTAGPERGGKCAFESGLVLDAVVGVLGKDAVEAGA